MVKKATWIVVQQGVYMQDVYGPFARKRTACVAAQQLAANDRDDYHAYTVHTLTKSGLGLFPAVAAYRKNGDFEQRTAILEDRERFPKRGGRPALITVTGETEGGEPWPKIEPAS